MAVTKELTFRTKFEFVDSVAGFEQALGSARVVMVKAECRGIIFAVETGGHY